MKKRIQELAEQAGIDFFNSTNPEYFGRVYCEGWTEQQQKFADLIIQECIHAVENTNDRHRRDYFAAKIREHFGIEQ